MTPRPALAILRPFAVAIAFAAAALPALAQHADPNGTSIYESLRLDSTNQPRPTKPGAQPRARKVIATGHRYAVVVGVAEAAGQHPLPFCLNDVSRLSDALAHCGYECARLSEREDTMPTHANALAAIQEMAAKAGPTDQILVYMSTHGGAPFGEPLLALKDEVMTLREIKEAMAASPALVRILILDACRDEQGFSTESAEIRDLHVILSCSPDEESGDSPNDMSLFTEVLVEALTDCQADRVPDGELELDEVLHYLDEHVDARANLYHPGDHQHPTRTVVDPRSLDPIFGTCPAARIAENPAEEPEADPDADEDNPAADNNEGLYEIAVEGQTERSLTNDLIITSDLVGKITLSMSRADLEKSMGEPTLGFSETFEQSGQDIVGYDDTPKAGDTLWVFFMDHHVSSVLIMGKGPCEGDFDLTKARAGFAQLCDGRSVEDTSDASAGMVMQEVYDMLGCPSTGLALQTGSGKGAAVYENVPSNGKQLSIVYDSDGVDSIKIEPMP